MNLYTRLPAVLLTLFLYFSGCVLEDKEKEPAFNQFPSPMVESIRIHERIQADAVPGTAFYLSNVLPKPVEIYFSNKVDDQKPFDLLLHFHGVSYVPRHAVYHLKQNLILAVINLGSGSSVYEKPFFKESVFPDLIEMIIESVSANKLINVRTSRVILSSFSAGYGAIRAILKNHQTIVEGIILLDGLHTDYIPSGRVLAQGGELNIKKLIGFVDFARLAIENKKVFLITHSEIFPGTYASTTETADFIIKTLKLNRKPVLEWGPMGMQMISKTKKSGLSILGFAGNSAPDHIDHFHGLPGFLELVWK